MFENQRRAKRKISDLPVQLVLYNSTNDNILAGPAASLLHDISYYGAGLIIDKVFHPPHHLFYDPRDHEDQVLCLEVSRQGEKESPITIPIKPVWLRLDQEDAAGYFRMGVEFMTDPEDTDVIDLEKMALAAFKEREDLLSKLVRIFD